MRYLMTFAALAVLAVAVGAQSGRRVRTVDTQSKADQTRSNAVTEKSEPADVGYSESAPTRPIPLSPRSNKKSDQPVSAVQPEKPKDKTDPTAEEADVIKVDTNLVTIPVSVTDREGFYVSNLYQANFTVFENGVEQKLEYFGTTDKPFTVVLLIDVSPSTSYKIEEIQAAAMTFVRELLPHDQVMVIEFDSGVHVLTEATTDREKIEKAIRRTGFGDGTSLYQAVDFSLRKRLDKIEGRKAIVLFTDGVDTTSSGASYSSTLRDAEESEAVIFPIYYNTFLQNIGIGGGGGPMSTPPSIGLPGSMGGVRATKKASEAYSLGRAYLNELANATGGKVFRAESTPGGLTTAFESIAEELRRQYVLGYYPDAVGAAGERRSIRVRVNRAKLIVRSRDSYIVGQKSN